MTSLFVHTQAGPVKKVETSSFLGETEPQEYIPINDPHRQFIQSLVNLNTPADLIFKKSKLIQFVPISTLTTATMTSRIYLGLRKGIDGTDGAANMVFMLCANEMSRQS